MLKYVDGSSADFIKIHWDERMKMAKSIAQYNGLHFDYRLWRWDHYVRSRDLLCFGLFDDEDIEALAACRFINGRGLEMEYLASAPDNYYRLRDERTCPGAGRLLVAGLARICREHAADAAELSGRKALIESFEFYQRLGFEPQGGYDPAEEAYRRIVLRVPPLDVLIEAHYTTPRTRGAEQALDAIQPRVR
jgi:hypothetical protein